MFEEVKIKSEKIEKRNEENLSVENDVESTGNPRIEYVDAEKHPDENGSKNISSIKIQVEEKIDNSHEIDEKVVKYTDHKITEFGNKSLIIPAVENEQEIQNNVKNHIHKREYVYYNNVNGAYMEI